MDRVPNGAWKTSQIEGWEVVVGFHQTEYSLVVTVHHLIHDVHHMHVLYSMPESLPLKSMNKINHKVMIFIT